MERVAEKEKSTGARQLLFKTTEKTKKTKTEGTDTEKQVSCTAPAEPLFIQIKPGGLLSVCFGAYTLLLSFAFVGAHVLGFFCFFCLCLHVCVHEEH